MTIHRLRARSLDDVTTLPALRLVHRSHALSRLLGVVTVLILVVLSGLVFVPWTQTVSGTGRVVALDPLDRTQTIEAAITGQIVECLVVEGSRVRAGDKLIELRDNAPDLVQQLERQRRAAELKRDATRRKEEACKRQVKQFEEARTAAVEGAKAYIAIAEQEVLQAEQDIQAANADVEFSKNDYERTKKLWQDGIEPLEKYQASEQKFLRDQAKATSSQAKRVAARSKVKAANFDLEKVTADATAKMEYAQALVEEAHGDFQIADKELSDIEVKRQQQITSVVAPRDGTVLQVIANQGAELVYPGDPLLRFVPDTQGLAVELLVDGNDVPLIADANAPHAIHGDPVRLQFEGWPAVQFAGWPSVAVGTFGGKVWLVDATIADPKTGKFRILVVPDIEDQPWPTDESGQFHLRQGMRANGWVLLREVPLGWEIWRRLNGFPPVIADEPPGAEKPTKDKGSKPKVPK